MELNKEKLIGVYLHCAATAHAIIFERELTSVDDLCDLNDVLVQYGHPTAALILETTGQPIPAEALNMIAKHKLRSVYKAMSVRELHDEYLRTINRVSAAVRASSEAMHKGFIAELVLRKADDATLDKLMAMAGSLPDVLAHGLRIEKVEYIEMDADTAAALEERLTVKDLH